MLIEIKEKKDKKRPPVPSEESMSNEHGEKKKRKNREEAKEDKSFSRKLRESSQKLPNDLKRNDRQEREFRLLLEGTYISTIIIKTSRTTPLSVMDNILNFFGVNLKYIINVNETFRCLTNNHGNALSLLSGPANSGHHCLNEKRMYGMVTPFYEVRMKYFCFSR